ncbi:MAG: peptide ABC transporter substrate-binding protein [Candidatus Eremiobacteraeota bacterium]|nr:peptide ABC transporter substrate-binding protein [Candidatus Eremiobacteraeota bacterium]
MINRAQGCLVLCALLVLMIAPSCTRSPSEFSGRQARGNSWTIHGVLRIADTRQPDSLNPLLSFGQVATDLSMFWAAYLFRWNDRNELVPELATQVPTQRNGGISQDGLTITYQLRKGVRWHDGAPFTADDVLFTWQQVMNPLNNVQGRVGYDSITSIEALDSARIRVHLKQRFAPFVETFFTMSGATYCILPKHLLSGHADINHAPYNSLPIGTGPFRVAAYEKASEIRFVANRSYWRGPPHLKEIVYRIVPDDNTVLTQLNTHEADFWMAAPIVHIAALRSIPGVRIYRIPFTAFEFLGFNTEHAALQDVRVRQALRLATDVGQLASALAHNRTVPAQSDQPPFSWAFNADLKKYPYDPIRAAQLLDQARWKRSADGYRYKNGQRLDLVMVSAIGSSLGSAIDLLVQSDWKKIGVNVAIKNYPTDLLGSADGIYRTGRFDVFFDSWTNGVDPDDSQIFMCNQRPPRGANYFRFCNRTLDAAEQVALREYSRAQRKPAYDTIQAILAQEQPIIVLWFDERQDVANSDLRAYRPAHAVTTFWNPWEWSI